MDIVGMIIFVADTKKKLEIKYKWLLTQRYLYVMIIKLSHLAIKI